MTSYEDLPNDLPIPEDDGACDHLVGLPIPDIDLPKTDGELINLSKQKGRVVIYCYPMTGKPDAPMPDGWDDIPGARGCTPQNCSFRDHFAELSELGASVFGMSTQDTNYQKELAERLHLPYPLITDEKFEFCEALNMPTFTIAGMRLMKRTTLIFNEAIITDVHYPVFPSNKDAEWVIAKLS